MIMPHAPLKMNLSTSTNKPLEGNKVKCCQCGFTNTFWELELANLERQLNDREKIIYEKDRCLEEKDKKIQHLENELMRLKKKASSINSASVNDTVQNDNTVSIDSKTATQSKKQLSADAPEFKFHSASPVPVVSANGVSIKTCEV